MLSVLPCCQYSRIYVTCDWKDIPTKRVERMEEDKQRMVAAAEVLQSPSRVSKASCLQSLSQMLASVHVK